MEVYMSKRYIYFLIFTFLICLIKPSLSCVTFLQINGASTTQQTYTQLSWVDLSTCMTTCNSDVRCQGISWDRSSELCKIYHLKIISTQLGLDTTSLFLVTRSSLFCSAGTGCPVWNEWRSKSDSSTYGSLKLQRHIDVSNSMDMCAEKAATLTRKEFLYDSKNKICYLYFENGLPGEFIFSSFTKHYPPETLNACTSDVTITNANPNPNTTPKPPPKSIPNNPPKPPTKKVPTTTTTTTTTTTKESIINIKTATTKVPSILKNSTTKYVRKTPSIVTISYVTTNQVNGNETGNNTRVTETDIQTSQQNNGTGISRELPKAQSLNQWNRSLLVIRPVYIVLAGLGLACGALTFVAIMALCQGKMGGKGGSGGGGGSVVGGGSGGGGGGGGSDPDRNYFQDEEADIDKSEYVNSHNNVEE